MLQLYSYADPKAKIQMPERRDYFAFSYLHGPAQHLNQEIMSKNGWDYEADDLFVAERDPKPEEKILVSHNTELEGSKGSLKDGMYPKEGLELHEDGNPKLWDYDLIIIDLYAIECSFYGHDLVAFVSERTNYSIYNETALSVQDAVEMKAGSHICGDNEVTKKYFEGTFKGGRVVVKYIFDRDNWLKGFDDNREVRYSPEREAWEHALSYHSWT